MPLSAVVNGFMQALRSFLADDESVLLELEVSAEQGPQAARVLDAVAAEQDDLVIPLEHTWSDAPALCSALAAELADSAARAGEAFGEDEPLRFALPPAPRAGEPPLTEVELLEYAESLQRSLSNHVRRVVIVLALRCDPALLAQCGAVVRQLVQVTGTPEIKWVLFGTARLVQERTLPRLRRGPHPFDPSDAAAGLLALLRSPAERVHTLRRERSVLRLIEREVQRHVVPGTRFLAVVVHGISYGNRMFFFTEAARDSSRQCAELERSSSGGQHVVPLYDEAHELVGHEQAETHFAEFCERLTKAMLKDDGGLLVILAPNEGRD